MAQVRPYRGIEAPDRVAGRRLRLLDAGLDLLGAAHDGTDADELTVRAVCRRANLTLRYFYESFPDKDTFVGAVFDRVIADIAATTEAAMATAPTRERLHAGMGNIVRTIADDPRVGRLLFSTSLANAVLVRKRVESGALFAMLSGQHAGAAMGLPENDRLKATAHFVVGGVAQTISAWLAGDVGLRPDQLVDQLTSILEELTEPRLFRD